MYFLILFQLVTEFGLGEKPAKGPQILLNVLV